MTGKTYVATPSTVDRKWLVVDAEGKRLGILASAVARMLTGKNKPTYTPNIDTGDFVVVVNAEKIELSGTKADKKVYRHHSMYPGGLKEIPYRKMQAEHPERVIELAVKGMLPKNKLGDAMFGKLKVYAGPNHPHTSQSPVAVEIGVKRNA
ncbi:MAG TPA: 50S ribosomal protein L13 [Chloroflexota bacterium]|nr:50S ribosomal protein L13 [Chloroflexota bacterium]